MDMELRSHDEPIDDAIWIFRNSNGNLVIRQTLDKKKVQNPDRSLKKLIVIDASFTLSLRIVSYRIVLSVDFETSTHLSHLSTVS